MARVIACAIDGIGGEPATEQLRLAEDARQRRAELVGGGGEEVALEREALLERCCGGALFGELPVLDRGRDWRGECRERGDVIFGEEWRGVAQ
ncbi:MAG: hypothetical protein WCL53_04550 [Chloroflexota bacterium]